MDRKPVVIDACCTLNLLATSLRWRANFAPPRRDPRGEWYLALLKRAGIAMP